MGKTLHALVKNAHLDKISDLTTQLVKTAVNQKTLTTLKIEGSCPEHHVRDIMDTTALYGSLQEFQLFGIKLTSSDAMKLTDMKSLQTLTVYNCEGIELSVLQTLVCKDVMPALTMFGCDEIFQLCKYSTCHPDAMCMKRLQWNANRGYTLTLENEEDLAERTPFMIIF